MTRPFVSVLIDTYNHEGFIEQALVSVLEQPYRLHLGDLATDSLFSHLRCFLGTSRITIRKGILDRILPVPKELVVEADEFIFTLAVAIGGALILDEPLFYYRLHGGNL